MEVEMAASALPMAVPPPSSKKILVTATKGGCGKTVTSIHLATAAAKQGLHVVGIDYDPQQNFLRWAKRRVKHGNTEIRVIAGSLEEYRDALDAVGPCDLVVIDTPPGVGHSIAAMQGLCHVVDLVLVPTSLSINDLDVIVPYATALSKVRGKRVHFALNRIDARIMEAELTDTVMTLSKVGHVNAVPIPTLVDIERNLKFGESVIDVNSRRGTANVLNLWNYIQAEIERG
jgi:chromosome partitioning protein